MRESRAAQITAVSVGHEEGIGEEIAFLKVRESYRIPTIRAKFKYIQIANILHHCCHFLLLDVVGAKKMEAESLL